MRLLLLRLVGLLHHPAAAGRDGRRGRRAEPAVAVYRHAHRHAHLQSAVRGARLPTTTAPFRLVGLPVLHGQHPCVLSAPAGNDRRAKHLGRPHLLHLDERLQPVRRLDLLGVHGRRLHERARQAAIRLHRRRWHVGRHRRLGSHGGARRADRSRVPAARLDCAAGSRCLQRAASVDHLERISRTTGLSASGRSDRWRGDERRDPRRPLAVPVGYLWGTCFCLRSRPHSSISIRPTS